ncbi:hypothetical protein N9917_02055 [Deltaproteobacteria bacterium]|nr:hypothetical protein [Deltaproteobacteria bacterium]
MANNVADQYFKQSDTANNNFGAGTAFMPAIYSKKVLNFFRKASVAEAITNTDYAGEISAYGDSVKIIKEPTITIYQYERGADVTETKLTDTEVSLVVNTANAFKFVVDDIETSMSHVNFKEVAASSAAYALRDAFDLGVITAMLAGVSIADHVLGTDAANAIGGQDFQNSTKQLQIGTNTASDDPLDLLAHMARKLDEENVPEEGRWFVAGTDFYEALGQSSSKLLSVDFNAGQGSIRNGLVSSGKLRGFSMYKSNNVPAPTNAQAQCMAGHISSTATAQTITSTEVIRDPDSFGDICRGLHVYGVKVLRPEAIVKAFYKIVN